MPAQRAEQEVDLLLQHQTPRLGQRLVRIAGGVGDDDLDLAAAGLVVGLSQNSLKPSTMSLPGVASGPVSGASRPILMVSLWALAAPDARKCDEARTDGAEKIEV